MSTTIDLFAPAELAQPASGSGAIEYPAAREGEPTGDVQDVGARVHPNASGTTSPAASGNVSSAVPAVSNVGTVRGAERATAMEPPAGAGCCGGCGEWTKTITGFGHCEHLPHWTTTSPRAACHFNPSRWVAISAETRARRETQAAIDRAADEADSQVQGWSDRALQFIKTFAESNRGKQFIATEIVSASLQTDLPQPMTPEAWGRPIQQAARQKAIKRAGQDANRVPLWEAA